MLCSTFPTISSLLSFIFRKSSMVEYRVISFFVKYLLSSSCISFTNAFSNSPVEFISRSWNTSVGSCVYPSIPVNFRIFRELLSVTLSISLSKEVICSLVFIRLTILLSFTRSPFKYSAYKSQATPMSLGSPLSSIPPNIMIASFKIWFVSVVSAWIKSISLYSSLSCIISGFSAVCQFFLSSNLFLETPSRLPS